jgi:hypothetical protein
VPEEPGEGIARNRDARGVSHDGGGALIDGDQARLTAIADAVFAAVGEAIEQEQETATGSYEISGEETTFELPMDRGFLTWVAMIAIGTATPAVIGAYAAGKGSVGLAGVMFITSLFAGVATVFPALKKA